MRSIISFILYLSLFFSSLAIALEEKDQKAIHDVIDGYTEAWNHHEGKGFGEGFSEDADFVNIFGMHFSGRNEIEERHVQILKGFLKGSSLEVVDIDLREVTPELVIALVTWKLTGFNSPPTPWTHEGAIREGIFTQVFIQNEGKWEITASQNTLKPVAKQAR